MNSLQKVKRQPIATQVYEAVREAIFRGDMAPGSHLSEVDLSEQLGVSRAPIREALLQLEAEGIVELVPNKGAFVRGLSYKEVEEIYTTRSLLEGYAAALAAEHASPADINKIIFGYIDTKSGIDHILQKCHRQVFVVRGCQLAITKRISHGRVNLGVQ